MGKRFSFGELNPNISSRTGQTIDPQRFSAQHIQQKLIEQFTEPSGFKTIQGPLRGIVLRIEPPSFVDSMGGYFGLGGTEQERLVRIKVRIPELHPLPDPDVYGPEGPDGIISLYPTFVAIDTTIGTPGVGEIVYVDYKDRENLEDPTYYGPVFVKPILGAINEVKSSVQTKASSLFDSGISAAGSLFGKAADSLSNWMAPPTNTNEMPTAIVPNTTTETPKVSNTQIFSTHPVVGSIRSKFGSRTNPINGKSNTNHNGVDYGCPTGTPVVSIGEGVVESVSFDDRNGNYVVISGIGIHEGYSWSYAHLSKVTVKKTTTNSKKVKEKTKVKTGEKIGLSGATGQVTGPHLHFVIRNTPKDGARVAVDPLPLLPTRAS